MSDQVFIAEVKEYEGDGDNTALHEVHLSPTAKKRCGVSFNPTNSGDVNRVKLFMAAAMSVIEEQKDKAVGDDQRRCFESAMTQLESAQMFAVKGLFQ